MFIFSIVSVPCLFIILNKEIKFKSVLLFFVGIIASSILSLLCWSFSTLISFDSDWIFNKLIKISFVSILPIFILNLFIIINNLSRSRKKQISFSFISGYLYWSLLFSILIDFNITNNLTIILLPIIYMIVILFYWSIQFNKFKKFDNKLKVMFLFLIPLFILFANYLYLTNLLIFIILVLIIVSIIYVSLNNVWGIKNKIFEIEK